MEQRLGLGGSASIAALSFGIGDKGHAGGSCSLPRAERAKRFGDRPRITRAHRPRSSPAKRRRGAGRLVAVSRIAHLTGSVERADSGRAASRPQGKHRRRAARLWMAERPFRPSYPRSTAAQMIASMSPGDDRKSVTAARWKTARRLGHRSAETFIVPAVVGEYTIRPYGAGQICGVARSRPSSAVVRFDPRAPALNRTAQLLERNRNHHEHRLHPG
jgi:hypothetical protein